MLIKNIVFTLLFTCEFLSMYTKYYKFVSVILA